MNLTLREKDKLLVSVAAMVARARLALGLTFPGGTESVTVHHPIRQAGAGSAA